MKRLLLLLMGSLLIAGLVSAQDEEEAPLYLDADAPIDARVDDLLERMTLEEKIGQMTLIEKNSVDPETAGELLLGGILSGGGGYPEGNNSTEGWAEMVGAYQDAALATRLGIPIIYGVDAVHGHSNVVGSVIFPHNIGLGATRNPELVQEIGRITALEMAATGIYWNYAPSVAVAQDLRWGRTYESYAERPDLVSELGVAYMLGLQGDDLAAESTVLATIKHFVGDGGAVWGTSPFGQGNIDRGITAVDEATLRERHLPPYIAAIENGAFSVMASYTSWGGMPMHAQDYLLNGVLKGELGFEGFVVSDWEAINVISSNYREAVTISTNAGIDMNMVPYEAERFIAALTSAVEAGDVSMERIDDAVSRILTAKFRLGLFEQAYEVEAFQDDFGSDDHRAVARQAVSESLVLLKNENDALPLLAEAETIFLAGGAANDVGIQSGGWTIEWQGGTGNITDGTTILEAMIARAPEGTDVEFSRGGRFNTQEDADGNPVMADVGVVVLGEEPYAEWFGDDASISLTDTDQALVQRVRERSEKLVVVLLSGRPLILGDVIGQADAVVAAWLPGTEGAGIVDVLYGDALFVGRLPFTWPRSVAQVGIRAGFGDISDNCSATPLFPYDYGLDFDTSESEWLDLAISCVGEELDDELAVSQAVASTSATIGSVEETAVASAETRIIFVGDYEGLAPEGTARELYFAPFPVFIVLDGEFDDWAGVPTVTVPDGGSGSPSATFAVASDGDMLYMRADIIDDNIISGEHGTDYWNEDSAEFYVNATGDLTITSYQDGAAQVTVPALNIGAAMDEVILAGVRGDSAQADVVVVETETGWAIEMGVPMNTEVWNIDAADGNNIGFQFHLNAASTQDRDAKLIWSRFDTGDQSYQNPSLFGELIFYEIRETE